MGRYGPSNRNRRRRPTCQEKYPDDEDARLECIAQSEERKRVAIGFVACVAVICLISALINALHRRSNRKASAPNQTGATP
jgi:uncharacterized membrane protein